MGPRAWSRWVDMPISHPSPNTPPSVNRVEAFQYTAAESTRAVKRRAASSLAVTTASEWPVEWAEMWAAAASTPSTTLTARI